ncbi:hypothetical protein COOONC_22634 [Cooperia oncophora]
MDKRDVGSELETAPSHQSYNERASCKSSRSHFELCDLLGSSIPFRCSASWTSTSDFCEQQRFAGIDAFKLPASQSAIQREIMKNGPVVAIFNAYQDFSYYAGGIYKVRS